MRLLARCASAALLLIPLAAAPAAAVAPDDVPPVPLHRSARPVAGQYIVTLNDQADPTALLGKLGITPLFSYRTALRGFAATLDATQLEAVRRLPGVVAVEENGQVGLDEPADPPAGPDRIGRPAPTAPTATAASWGLDRIDQHTLPLDGDFTVTGSGKGVTAYIVDTGIDFAHSEFGGRAVPGFDAINDGRNGQDCQGHGTHVAGTVGGATYGVARQASLVSVRVFGCEATGSWAAIIAGFDWVGTHAKQPAVLNASLGGPLSPAVNAAADSVARHGVLPVVAAGNSAEDACGISPASASRALAVGASDSGDRETDFSNYGECLGLYAPGAAIVSARLGGGSVAHSGTSMASPHVTGVAALYKATHPTATARTVARWITDQATRDALGNVSSSSPNRLLYTSGL